MKNLKLFALLVVYLLATSNYAHAGAFETFDSAVTLFFVITVVLAACAIAFAIGVVSPMLGVLFFICVPGMAMIAAVNNMENLDGHHPWPGHESIYTYQEHYEISLREHQRVEKYFNQCGIRSPFEKSCEFLKQDCVGFNICRGPFKGVYEERRVELARNPNAFEANKLCWVSSFYGPKEYNCW